MKKILSLALSFALLFAVVAVPAVYAEGEEPPVGETTTEAPAVTTNSLFTDLTDDHWAYASIETLVKKGVINGYEDGTFLPENQVSRSEFAKMMVLTLGLTLDSPVESSFADVDSSAWDAQYIEAVKAYLTGYTEGEDSLFKGDNAAVREDLAAALVRALGLEEETVSESAFTDYEDITPELRDLVQIASQNKIVNGYPDGTFLPKNSITRAEAASLLVKVLDFAGLAA
ncbi:hypothetical protein FACS189425_06810 [Clostridia bacterium]|nr:hypothetical protein FACS189425_06810 [Clostridia bacterium]